MKKSVCIGATLALLALVACGSQVVEFPEGSNPAPAPPTPGAVPPGEDSGTPPQECLDQNCPLGQACRDGVCTDVDPCEGVQCPEGDVCQNGACVPTDPCAGVQ